MKSKMWISMMIRGIYSATSGLITASEQHDIISINLANINTPSFKEIQITFSEADNTTAPKELNGVKTETTWDKSEVGGFIQTGRPLDLAIADSDRYFLLLSDNGQLVSRYGHFILTPDGILVDSNGYLLLGTSGPIRLPADTNNIAINSNGTVIADGEEVDRIRTVTIANNNLKRVSANLYKPIDELSVRDVETRILQGYLETSNIKISDIFVKMMLGNRYYEATQKALRIISDVIQLNTRV
jgi:flagellar basal body rod protein FlgG